MRIAAVRHCAPAASANRANGEMSDIYLTEFQTSERLHVTRRTLQRWRRDGGGPPYVRIGAWRIVYVERDLQAWIAARTFAHRAGEMTGKPVIGSRDGR